MKNSVLNGSLVLLFAGIISKILGAVYRIPLSNILGADGIGIYQMIFPIFSLALIVSSGGVCTTIAHCVANIRATNCGSEKKVFFHGLLFSLFSSVFFAIIFFVLSKKISILQGNVMANNAYKISALALIFASLLAPFRGLFQGQQNMMPTATSQIIEQVVKVCFGLGFAMWFSTFSVEEAVCGAFLGVAISEICAFVFLLLRASKHKFFVVDKNFDISLKTNFWKINFSITLCSIILPLVSAFDSFVVVNKLSNYFSTTYATSLFGLQSGIVTSLINLPIIMSVAISLALLPNLSGLVAKGEIEKASNNLSKIIEILLIVLILFVLTFIFFAKDILTIIYPTLDENMLEIGKKLLQFSSINVLGISFLQVLISVFQSFGKASKVVFVLLGCALIKIVFMLFLISNMEINIFGVVLSNVLFYFLGVATLFLMLKKLIPIFVNERCLIVCLGSLLTTSAVFFTINVYVESILAKIFFAGICGLIFYVLPIVFFGGLNIKQFLQKVLRYKRNCQ